MGITIMGRLPLLSQTLLNSSPLSHHVPCQVKSLISSRDKDGFPVLYYATTDSSVEKFKAVMVAVSAELTPEEVCNTFQ